jgi:hypothetical protein
MESELTYSWEPCSRLFDEPNLPELLQEHYAEAGTHQDMPLDPDFAGFIRLNEEGRYRVWAARTRNQLFVGYLGTWIQSHMHHRQFLTAVIDSYMLSVLYRSVANTYAMFASAVAAIKDLGVQRIIWAVPIDRSGMEAFLKRLGFVHIENVWSLYLGS